MKKNTFFRRSYICILLLMTLYFAYAFLQTGCNNSRAQTKESVPHTTGANGSNNWISLNITFIRKTNEEMRDRSIRAIEKVLVKSVAPYMSKYANYYPSITITKRPFVDSLVYKVTIKHEYYTKNSSGQFMLLSIDTTGPTPPNCPPCPGLCPACEPLINYIGSSTYGIAKITIDEK